MKKFLFGMLTGLAGAAFAQDVLLAPGTSLTILDAADPTVRVVLTAPPDAPLDLSTILVKDPKESVYSIVTRLKLDAAGGLTRNADGSMTLSAPAASSAPTASMLHGGVMIYTAGKSTSPGAAATPTARPRSSCAAPTRSRCTTTPCTRA